MKCRFAGMGKMIPYHFEENKSYSRNARDSDSCLRCSGWTSLAIRKYFRVEKTVEDAGLEITVIESIPVHEDIKQGKPNRDKLIENYKTSIENVWKSRDSSCLL